LKAIGLEAIRLTLQAIDAGLAEPAIAQTTQQTSVLSEPAQIDDAMDEDRDSGRLKSIESAFAAEPKPSHNLLTSLLRRCQLKHSSNAEQVQALSRVDILTQLGAQIRLERERKGLTMAQLHAQTFIPLYHLKALENGDVAQLPEDVFLRGFFSRIEKALDLAAGRMTGKLSNYAQVVPSVLPCWVEHDATFRDVKVCDSNRLGRRASAGVEANAARLYMTYAVVMAGSVYWASSQTAPQFNLPMNVNVPDLPVYQPWNSVSSAFRQRLTQAKVSLSESKAKLQTAAQPKSGAVGSAQYVAPPEVIR
jgi:cytoskeletal protein RodZ